MHPTNHDTTARGRSERDYVRLIDAIARVWRVALDPSAPAAEFDAAIANADELLSRAITC